MTKDTDSIPAEPDDFAKTINIKRIEDSEHAQNASDQVYELTGTVRKQQAQIDRLSKENRKLVDTINTMRDAKGSTLDEATRELIESIISNANDQADAIIHNAQATAQQYVARMLETKKRCDEECERKTDSVNDMLLRSREKLEKALDVISENETKDSE